VVADTSVEPQSSYSSSSSSSSWKIKYQRRLNERTKNQIYNMHKRTPLFTPRTLFVKRFFAKMDEPVGIFEKDDYADCFTRAVVFT
jgi:hypothetical protein